MAGPATLTIAESSEAIAWPASTAVARAQGASTRRFPSLPATLGWARAVGVTVMTVTPLCPFVSSINLNVTDDADQAISRGTCLTRSAVGVKGRSRWAARSRSRRGVLGGEEADDAHAAGGAKAGRGGAQLPRD